MEKFGIHPTDYRHRARLRLAEGSRESLFYAALELRTGVETRLKQYLDAQQHVSKNLKRGWKIPKLAYGLRRAFDTGDKYIVLTIVYGQEKESVSFLFSPVTTKLQKQVERLGRYLHAVFDKDTNREDWWKEFRELSGHIALGLEKACYGNLLGAPLTRNEKPQRVHVTGEYRGSDSSFAKLDELSKNSTPFQMSARYFDDVHRQGEASSNAVSK